MQRILCLFVLLVIGQSYRTPVVFNGVNQEITFTQNPTHILHSGNQEGRTVDSVITFPQAFVATPQIILGNNMFHWQNGPLIGYKFWVQQQSLQQFTMRFQSLTNRQIYSLWVSWLATDDPRVFTADVDIQRNSLGSLRSGEDARREALVAVTYPEQALPASTTNVVVGVLLTGARMERPNSIVFISTRDVTRQGFTVVATTWYTVSIQYLKVTYVVADAAALFIPPTHNFRVPGNNHPWLTRGEGESFILFAVNVPPQWRQVERNWVWGFTGYDLDVTRNGRAWARNLRFDENNQRLLVGLGTWGDSKMYQLSAQAFLYSAGDYRIFNTECVEVFSESNYQGQNMEICSNVQSLAQQSWNQPIRSFWVPPGKTFRLYSQEGLRGQVASFTESQTNVDNFTFSLLEVHSE